MKDEWMDVSQKTNEDCRLVAFPSSILMSCRKHDDDHPTWIVRPPHDYERIMILHPAIDFMKMRAWLIVCWFWPITKDECARPDRLGANRKCSDFFFSTTLHLCDHRKRRRRRRWWCLWQRPWLSSSTSEPGMIMKWRTPEGWGRSRCWGECEVEDEPKIRRWRMSGGGAQQPWPSLISLPQTCRFWV
jgi:hypothetical protein